MICEGMIPERRVSSTVTREVKGDPVQQQDGTFLSIVSTVQDTITDTVPAKPCDAEATMRARSMEQVECNVGSLHWVKTEDKDYCAEHYVPGTMTHLDGLVTQHAPMSVNDV